MSMTFEEAIDRMKTGFAVRRKCWPSNSAISIINDVVRMRMPGPSNGRPWEIGQGAVVANDWEIAPDTIEPVEVRKVRLEDMKARMKEHHYYYDGLLTICVATMVNGFKVVGTSACIDPALYDRKKGEEIAFNDVIEQLWPLEGYLLAEQVAKEKGLL